MLVWFVVSCLEWGREEYQTLVFILYDCP
jgi:hypothetical protein